MSPAPGRVGGAMDLDTPARDQVLVRSLQPQDLEVVIAIDASKL